MRRFGFPCRAPRVRALRVDCAQSEYRPAMMLEDAPRRETYSPRRGIFQAIRSFDSPLNGFILSKVRSRLKN
jgi:hypothetical protein